MMERVESIKLGDPLDASSGMGSINSKVQYEEVRHYVAAVGEDGVQLVTGGTRP